MALIQWEPHLETIKETAEELLEDINSEDFDVEAFVKKAKTGLEDIVRESNELKDDIDELESDCDEFESDKEDLEDEVKDLEKKVSELEEEIQTLQIATGPDAESINGQMKLQILQKLYKQFNLLELEDFIRSHPKCNFEIY